MSMPTDNPYDSPTAAPPAESYAAGRTRTMKLKRVDPLSCGKMLGALYVFIGLFLAVLFVLMTVVGVVGGGGGNNMTAGVVGGLIGAVMIPIVYGILGFIGGLIMALLYNLCGSTIGGIEMQFEE